MLSVLACPVISQEVTGTVLTADSKGASSALPGVVVYWKNSLVAVTSDSTGNFSIAAPSSYPADLMFSLLGFSKDSITLSSAPSSSLKISLKSTVQLQAVNIVAKQSTTSYSLFRPLNTEVISGKELLKAACCNLSESFSTNASVDVAFTDAVSGAKKIQMLGLDGVYTQVLSENMPMLRGLSSAYGLNYIPGTWIENIYVTKGTGSVVNGYESISGQINLEFLKPSEEKNRVFINLYGNHKGRAEANIHLAAKPRKNVSTMLFSHVNDSRIRQDVNSDGFLDMPLTRQYNVFNRWDFNNGKNIEGQFGIKGLYESRQGGQTGFDYNRDRGTTNFYGIGIISRQLEYFSKTGFLFPSKPQRSIGIQTSGKYQDQEMYFGNRNYNGDETSIYVNAIFADIIKTTAHKYKVGLSYLYDNYDEKFNDSSFSRIENVPGVFAEYTYTYAEDLTIVAGIREDYHSIASWQFTPRLHLRYRPVDRTTLRLSAGRGFRTSNVFVENQAVFASSRNIVFNEKLLPEIAWNYGLSANQEFKLFGREAFINMDIFRTDFVNQVIMDLDQHVNRVAFYNLNGESRSYSLQVDVGFSPLKSLDMKFAYKWYDVKTTYNYELLDKPFIPKHRVMFNAAYATYMDIWKFDATVNWFGQSRIPSTVLSPEKYQLPTRSPDYFLLNAQITKKFRKFEIYLGGENILNYMQKNPIIAASDPFSSNFDASMIYAPVDGTIIYTGLRFTIK
jgi:outer membrane cobalamin receptor